jgi:L,D-transpeptidase ErfK/SrfK
VRRISALLIIAIALLGLAALWQWQHGIKEEESGPDMVPGNDEGDPVKEYSCNCEPDEVRAPEMLKEVATPSSQSEMKRPSGRIDIVVDTVDRTLTICVDGKLYREFPVAVGKPSTPSPPGQWQVVSKGAWSGGFGTRWLGLDMPWGKYGIHGTNKPWQIGDLVSGGCIRLFNHDVELIYDWIPIGTQVVITGNPFGPLRNPRRELGPGEHGPDVLAAQKRLKMLGFDPGAENGMYEQASIDAVKRFQEAHSMRVTGVVTDEVYNMLGLLLFE